MIRQAVILIPGGGEEPPGFLFGPVAGVPFLPRQVLGLRRAGITDITILAAHATQEYLIREFARQQSLPTKIKIISRWSDYVEPSDPESGNRLFSYLVGQYPARPKNIQSFISKSAAAGGFDSGGVGADAAGFTECRKNSLGS